jgi:hypothetical protein
MADRTGWNEKFYGKDYSKKVPGLTLAMAKKIGDEIGVDWEFVDLGEWIQGIKEELEHTGVLGGSKTAVIPEGDLISSARIAYEHLLEVPDYYSRLEQMEHDGEDEYPDEDAVKAWIAENRTKYSAQWNEAESGAIDVQLPKAENTKKCSCDCDKCS